jgi:hypothetical protein
VKRIHRGRIPTLHFVLESGHRNAGDALRIFDETKAETGDDLGGLAFRFSPPLNVPEARARSFVYDSPSAPPGAAAASLMIPVTVFLGVQRGSGLRSPGRGRRPTATRCRVHLGPLDRGRVGTTFDQMAQSIAGYEASAEVTSELPLATGNTGFTKTAFSERLRPSAINRYR